MTEPLRPMSTGQVLDQTFALYRKNFWLFVGIASVGPVANVIFQLMVVGTNVGTPFRPMQNRQPMIGPGNVGTFLLSWSLGYGILLAGLAISHAATVKAVAAVYLGRSITIGGAYKALWGRILSLFGTLILVLLMLMAASFIAGLVLIPVVLSIGFLARGSANPAAGVMVGVTGFLFVLAIIVVMVWIFARYALAIQACMVENLGPRASLRRSNQLTKGNRWRAVVIYGLFLILAVILGAGLGGVAGAAGALLHNKIAAAVMIYAAGFVAGSLTGPLATIGLSLLYYDERVRKEAFDLQLMLASLEPAAVPVVVPAQV